VGVLFYRRALRVSRLIPADVIRRKFKFNAREAVTFYSLHHNKELVQDRLQRGYQALDTFQRLLQAPPELVNIILKPFDFMEQPSMRPRDRLGSLHPLSSESRVPSHTPPVRHEVPLSAEGLVAATTKAIETEEHN
jgi:hypothetical protein